jgi:integrase
VVEPTGRQDPSVLTGAGSLASGLASEGAEMIGKVTSAAVDRLKPGDLLWDTEVMGFGARYQRKDVFYLVRYRWNGGQRFDSIGRHGSPWTPDNARKEAKRVLGLVAAGTDPRGKPSDGETFGAEVIRYLDRKRPEMKPRPFLEVERHLKVHAKSFHRLRLAEIDRRTIALRLAEIETASGPVARNRVRSSLSAFFNFAIREGLVEINPVTGTGKAPEGGSRDRVLSEVELRQVWRSLGEDQFGDIVRLLILTGQRREEIGGLRWSEIDFDRDLIVFPTARTKNKRLHELPLSQQARAILERQPRREDRDLIFGLGQGGFSGWSDCKAALDERLKLKSDWHLHDIRRTVATIMADKLGVLPHIIEAILNHVSGHRAGVAGIYNRAKYEAEMRQALQRWAVLLAPPRP